MRLGWKLTIPLSVKAMATDVMVCLQMYAIIHLVGKPGNCN